MNLRQAYRFVFFAVVVTVITACSSKPDGSELVGTWEDKSGGTMKIAKDGNLLFMTATDKQGRTNKMPVTINPDGTASIPGIFSPTSIAYVKSTDSLNIMGQTLVRAK